MVADYLKINLESKGSSIKGFCIKINDEFHITYAVILDGFHSFCLWHDEKNSLWHTCKFANIDATLLDQIIYKLSIDQE